MRVIVVDDFESLMKINSNMTKMKNSPAGKIASQKASVISTQGVAVQGSAIN